MTLEEIEAKYTLSDFLPPLTYEEIEANLNEMKADYRAREK